MIPEMSTVIGGQRTGLASRHEMLLRLEEAITTARTQEQRLALLAFNLRGFREININFGHHRGDQVLHRVMEAIQGTLRSCDQAFHVGGDEFAVLLRELKSPQVAHLAITRILDAIEEGPNDASNTPMASARAGGAIFPDHAGNIDDLMRAADSALYSAHKTRRRYTLYDSAINERNQQRIQLHNDLKEGLKRNQLLFHYQPQYDLHHNCIRGCEALIRWPHDTLGWINPELFITVAEESGLIADLTYWSLNVVLREWNLLAAGITQAPVSINLSAVLLNSREIVELVERAINIWGIDPASLVLEVTESAMMADPEDALRTLNALHERGIQISIDDFGTGYSSLAYLKQLPVKELKIDKSFVMNMMDNDKDRKIVQSVIDLAHNLNMHVVAEGIENRETQDLLASMGCDYGQGYYFSRPLPAEDVPPVLMNACQL